MKIYEKVLNVLLKFLELAFTASTLNRKSLHEIEWEAEEGSPSVLGEIEVRADAVIGIARTCLKKRPENINELLDTLEASSIYQSELLVGWLAASGEDYQEFLGYITAIENLRMVTMAFLKKAQSNVTKKGLPKNPDDLKKSGYTETSHPEAAKRGHRTFENSDTGDKVRFDKGKPGANGYEGKDHYHRSNPGATGKKDQYLDKSGNPCARGCDASHLWPGD